jgi:hypothetical protein
VLVLLHNRSRAWQIHRYRVATTHYARGIAHAALGDTDAAATDLVELLRSTALVRADHMLFNNTCLDTLAVAEHMLRGELHYRLGTRCVMVSRIDCYWLLP